MTQTETLNELATALAKAQGKIAGAPKDTVNPFFEKKYADLSNVITAMRAPFADNGLSVLQSARWFDGELRLVTRILHSSGEWVEDGGIPLIMDKKTMQGLGSAITYGRRYGLMAAAGIAPEDDDGNEAVKGAGKDGTTATAKWKGPLAVTKLKAAFGDFVKALAECKNLEAVKSLVASNDAMLDQLRVDKPEWYNGAGDVMGVDDRLQARNRALEVEPDPFTVLTINAPIEGDWRAKLEAALDNCPDVEAVNKLALANVNGMGKYEKAYPDKVQGLMGLFAKKRGALELAPAEGDPS